MKLTIVFDNYSLFPTVQSGWGYACYFPERRFLFDTGSEPRTLLHNLRALKFLPEEIRTVMLSHFHWDHIGGLFRLLEKRALKVFLHHGFSPRFAAEARRLGAEIECINKLTEILPGVYSTGPLPGKTLEAGLVVKGRKGISLITGCAHPGICEMVQFVQGHFDLPPRLIMGGFHMGSLPKREIRGIAERLKALGVLFVAPSHCTGEQAREIFAEVFGDGFISAGVGLALDL